MLKPLSLFDSYSDFSISLNTIALEFRNLEGNYLTFVTRTTYVIGFFNPPLYT